jgi:hypothetical protein
MEDKDTLYMWGTASAAGHFFVENFDRIRNIKDAGYQLEEAEIYTSFLVSHLIDEKLVDQADQIRIDITHPKTVAEDYIPEDPKLLKIRENLINKFGHEVVRRLNISLSSGTDI